MMAIHPETHNQRLLDAYNRAKIIHETKRNQGAEFAESVTTMYELIKGFTMMWYQEARAAHNGIYCTSFPIFQSLVMYAKHPARRLPHSQVRLIAQRGEDLQAFPCDEVSSSYLHKLC